MTLTRFLNRPSSALCFTTSRILSHPSNQRSFSTSKPFILAQGPNYNAPFMNYILYFVEFRDRGLSKRGNFCLLILSLFFFFSGRLANKRFWIFLNIRSSMSSSSSTSAAVSVQQQVERILEGRNDDHGGVIVEMTNEPLDPAVFASLLRASLSHWRLQVLLFHIGFSYKLRTAAVSL